MVGDPGREGFLDLRAVLSRCRDLGLTSVLCEGGAELAGSLLRDGLVDRLYLLIAPHALGADGVPAFADDADGVPWERYGLAFPPTALGPDTLITLDRRAD